MFLRYTRRFKDGKEHRYWSIVENHRGADRQVIQRQVLYLGEINDSQKAAWCRSIEVFESGSGECGKWLFYRRTDKHRKRRYGYSRDKRPDCVQVVIALVITPDGSPLAYEVMAGNTSDKTTLRTFLEKIEQQYS